jgi:hypothetical protein
MGGNICALVLLDLSSAFDTVDHNTLLNVLNRRFGIQEHTLDWFKSYLDDRTQTFHVGEHESGPHSVSCSVPQGSVLGPKEFIAYTEQIEEVISQHSVDHHLYADDTQLIKPAQLVDIPFVIDSLQQCVFELHRWCASRRLQLNPSKTEIIWFGSRSSLSKMEGIELALHVGNDVIEPTSCVRDLGVFLDCELSMKQANSTLARSPVHVSTIYVDLGKFDVFLVKQLWLDWCPLSSSAGLTTVILY